jgi:hypothetical protein
MEEQDRLRVRRRGFLRLLTLSGVAAAASAVPVGVEALAEAKGKDDKRKALYQPNSPEVQTFYRVNRYPKR